MKKLLFVHHSGELGGAPRSLSLLIDNIDPKKYDTSLLCIYLGPVIEVFKEKPVKLVINRRIYPFHGSTVVDMTPIVFWVNLLGPPLSFWNSREEIKKVMPDIIHLNSSCLWVTALAARTVSKKIKIICHVREPLRKSFAGNIIRNMCYKFVDHFVAIDHFTGASMKTRNNIDIIYNPVDFKEYYPELKSTVLRDELNLPADAVVFLFIARVAKGNGLHELIDCANALISAHPNYHYVIAGLHEDHPDAYSKEIVKRAADNPNVHVMPFRKDVPQIIASCDVVLIPFTEPHFARAAIEAASIGKPCIGANIGGVDELIVHGKTGFLYDNLSELEEYCVTLGEDPLLRKEFGEEAFVFSRKNFDAEESSKRVFKAYED
jgi:glycosyltransferase involved in cell wall biosynthesis